MGVDMNLDIISECAGYGRFYLTSEEEGFPALPNGPNSAAYLRLDGDFPDLHKLLLGNELPGRTPPWLDRIAESVEDVVTRHSACSS
jgi:hypothetical protein